MKNTAIVLAGGQGSRMNSAVKKQYLQLGARPVLWYSLEAFERCGRIDEVVLVCGAGEKDWCREQFAERYGFRKVARITEGGKERYDSVYEGLKAAGSCDYVLIHDGARPFVGEEMLDRLLDALPGCGACVAAVPVKDTIKLGGEDGFAERTLPRNRLWSVQTPQAFAYPMILDAYRRLESCEALDVAVTDDAMVAEHFLHVRPKLVEGSYNNIKITTPEDLLLAEAILARRCQIRKSVVECTPWNIV